MNSSLFRLNKLSRVASRSLLSVQAAKKDKPVEEKPEEKKEEENIDDNLEDEEFVDEFYEEQEKLRAKGYTQEQIDEILFKEFEEEEKPKEEIKIEEQSVKEKPKEKKSLFSGLFNKKSSKKSKKEEAKKPPSSASAVAEEEGVEEVELKEGEGEEEKVKTNELEKKEKPKESQKKGKMFNFLGKYSFNIKDEIKGAWSELVDPDKSNNRLFKKEEEKEEEIKTPEEKEEESKKETENINKESEKIKSQLVVSEYKTAWDRFSAYLKNAPLIEDIMSAGQRIRETAVGETITDSVEHFREQWETSQHPLVYKMSEVYSEVFSENDVRASVREVQKSDPTFLEIDFQQEINNDTIPTVLHSYLDGDTEKLKEICNEPCYSKLAAAIQQRKVDNLSVDNHIIKIKPVRLEKAVCMEKEKPIFIYMTSMHHINCIKDSKGKIIEGREDLVMETFYLFAFQLELDMKRNAYDWKLADIQQAGSMPVI